MLLFGSFLIRFIIRNYVRMVNSSLTEAKKHESLLLYDFHLRDVCSLSFPSKLLYDLVTTILNTAI